MKGTAQRVCLKSPALVQQEIWGHLCCHYAIRTLMFAAAHAADIDPDRVSFVAAPRITRRSLSQARGVSPTLGSEPRWAHALVLLCRRLNPIRRHRSNPRVIKRKMPRWHVKRAHHCDWPQPTGPPIATIRKPQLNGIAPNAGLMTRADRPIRSDGDLAP